MLKQTDGISCKQAIFFAKRINFQQLYKVQAPNVCPAIKYENSANQHTFTPTNIFFYFIPNTVLRQCGGLLS